MPEKEHLVFKFILNGSEWVTSDEYTKELDAHGNENNFVNEALLFADRSEDTLPSPGSEMSESTPERDLTLPAAATEAYVSSHTAEPNSFNETEKVASDAAEENGDVDEAKELKNEDEMEEIPIDLSVPDIGSGGAAEVKVLGLKEAEPAELNMKLTDAEHEEDLAYLLHPESAFTEVSYVTSSSYTVPRDLIDAEGSDAAWEMAAVQHTLSGPRFSDADDTGAGLEFDTAEVSLASADATDDEDAIVEDAQSSFTEPQTAKTADAGLMLKLRGFLRF